MSNVSEMSVEELERILAEKKKEKKDNEIRRREAYEAIRAELIQKVKQKVHAVGGDVRGLFDFIESETGAFIEVMNEYGQVRRVGQSNFCISDDTFKIIIRTNNVKGFDERADVAATRLMPSTTTLPPFTELTLPSLPLSLPAITLTVSPFLILLVAILCDTSL